MAAFLLDEFVGDGPLDGRTPDAGPDWADGGNQFKTEDGLLYLNGPINSHDQRSMYTVGTRTMQATGFRLEFMLKIVGSGWSDPPPFEVNKFQIFFNHGGAPGQFLAIKCNTDGYTGELQFFDEVVSLNWSAEGFFSGTEFPGYMEITPTEQRLSFLGREITTNLTWTPILTGYTLYFYLAGTNAIGRFSASDLDIVVDAVDSLVLVGQSTGGFTLDWVEDLVLQDSSDVAITQDTIETLVLDDVLPAPVVVISAVQALVLGESISNLATATANAVQALVLRAATKDAFAFDVVQALLLADESGGPRVFDAGDRLVLRETHAPSAAKTGDAVQSLVLRDAAGFVAVWDLVDTLLLAEAWAAGFNATQDAVAALVLADETSQAAVQRVDGVELLVLRATTNADGSIYGLNVADRLVLRDELLREALMAAWVMNAGTGAMSRYTGMPVESMAVIGNRVIGLGYDGFFEFNGAKDDGRQIRAQATTGKLLLGADMEKYLGDINLTYASKSPLQVGVHAYGQQHKGWFNYLAEKRKADSPAAGRVKPGAGLCSLYYQFRVANTGGAAASFKSATVVVAPSTQRKSY